MGRSPKVSPQVAGPASICNAITDNIIADRQKNVQSYFSDILVYASLLFS